MGFRRKEIASFFAKAAFTPLSAEELASRMDRYGNASPRRRLLTKAHLTRLNSKIPTQVHAYSLFTARFNSKQKKLYPSFVGFTWLESTGERREKLASEDDGRSHLRKGTSCSHLTFIIGARLARDLPFYLLTFV